MHTSYFSLERCKTSEFNELLAEQSKQRIHHKLKILEKSIELQKEQLLEEEFEAESQVQLAHLECKSHFSSNSSVNSVTSAMQSLPSVVLEDSFVIYKNPKTDKTTSQMHLLTKENLQVAVQINKDFSNSNNLTPKPNLKTNHKKQSSQYTCETVVDKSKIVFDDLQNFNGNKTHEKLAQSIDSFIDELVKG